MAVLLAYLACRGEVPEALGHAAQHVFGHFALLFVPAGVGVVLHFERIGGDFVAIAVTILVGTAATIGVTALVVQGCLRLGVAKRISPEGQPHDEPVHP